MPQPRSDGEKMETVTDFIFLGSKITMGSDCSHEIKRHLFLGGKAVTNLDNILKNRDITLLTKVHRVKAMVFPVVMYKCESWTIKKAEHQRTDAFKSWGWKRLLRVLHSKEIKPVNPKGNQPWIFVGRTDAQAEAPTLRPPIVKSQHTRKDSDAGKDGGQEEKWVTEDEMVGWHHQLNGHEFEQTLGVGDWQGGLACGSPWGHKESDMTERLTWTELIQPYYYSASMSGCERCLMSSFLIRQMNN